MTDAGVLTFTPEEYQVLEDIEFDETVQRPEAIRFYTLEEQAVDAYEKMMPKGRVTRYQQQQLQKEVDRLEELYETFVLARPEDYALREPTYGKRLPWVLPVYAESGYARYDWARSWNPLAETPRQPNFYPTLLAALPRPMLETQEGTPYPMTDPTTFVSDAGTKPRRLLPEFLVPRTQIHEDRTVSILRVPAQGTRDAAPFVGYYLQKRPLEVPNPLPEHPFLSSAEARFVSSTAPLEDVVPSLDAILTHGVPATQDPYGEAAPYLKLYDVQLSAIPWSTWKSKFPPVDLLQVPPEGEPLVFPAPNQLAPPQKLTEAYKTPYEPGVSVRHWLMQRVDGGGLVVELLRSSVIDNGSVESIPGVDLPQAAYPETTIKDCSLEGKSFPDFTITGILRQSAPGKYQCVPLEFIKQERARAGYLNRLPWKETTGEEIKTAYLRRLAEVIPRAMGSKKEPPLAKTPEAKESPRRREVLAIQTDPTRFNEDKYRDLQELLRETTLTNQRYTDAEGAFVACAHTLALLGGDLATDRRAYYDKWAAKVDGYRVCKFCGEVINDDDVVEQEDYTEDGFRIRDTEALQGQAFVGETIRSFTTGLQALRPLFVLENAHDETVFLLLSLLQVLPSRERLEPLLKLGRTVASVQFGKGPADQVAKFTGIAGIATAAFLLQTHIPTLVPRRSFGPRPLLLSGYPRDSAEPEKVTIVDTLMSVLRKTFEAFPTSFKGPSKQVIKAVLTQPAEVKRVGLLLLSAKSPYIATKQGPTFVPALLVEAKAYQIGQPTVELPPALLPVVFPPKELGTIVSFAPCPSNRPIWTSGRVPRVLQASVPLWPGIQASSLAQRLVPSESVRVVPEKTPTALIRSRRAKGKGLQTKLRVGTGPQTNLLIASRLADLMRAPLPLRSVDPTESADALRDIAQGFAYEAIATAQASPAKRAQLEEARTTDAALYVLQAEYADQKREVAKLRATERLKIVTDMAKKSDMEREVIGDLLRIGLAPYIVTLDDRSTFAREAERLRDMMAQEEAQFAVDDDIGTGLARDYEDDGDLPVANAAADFGDYGDRAPLPLDRDYPEATIFDDPSRSI